MKSLILSSILILTAIFPLFAQTNATSADANVIAVNQAPDAVIKSLSDLVHAGKYPEAQQLVTGLLAAYPDDQRLTKAKTLLDKLLAAQSADSVSSTSQSANSVAPTQQPTGTPSEHLTGMDRVDYSALIQRAREAEQTTDLDQQKHLLQQFMVDSREFLLKRPEQMVIWELRAQTAISLDDPDAGYEAGQKLLAAGVADSNDPKLQQLMALLKNNGWLDKEKVEEARKEQDYKKFGWILGTWDVNRAMIKNNGTKDGFYAPGTVIVGKNEGEKEEFVKLGTIIEGYEISGDNVKSAKPDLRGSILNSGEIKWECYLPPSETDGIYVFREGFWGESDGRTKSSDKVGLFYPSGWQPVTSSEVGSDKTTISIIIPMQWSRPKDPVMFGDMVPVTLTFTKDNNARNQQSQP